MIFLALAVAALGTYLLLRPDTLTVPDVTGQRGDAAAQTLQDRGFEVQINTVQSDEVARDRVVTQDPAGGEEADEGSTVTITVSGGPGEASVPGVAGPAGRRGRGDPARGGLRRRAASGATPATCARAG